MSEDLHLKKPVKPIQPESGLNVGEIGTIDPDLACERCGRFGAVRIADHLLCVDCYEGSGSCCAESEMEDLDE